MSRMSPLAEAICRHAREERARRCQPGSDQEAAWHQLVPRPELRQPCDDSDTQLNERLLQRARS